MHDLWLILGGIVVMVVVIFLVLGKLVGRLRAEVAAKVKQELGESSILRLSEMANCFGIRGAGSLKVRGNGCLAATRDVILFIQWAPRNEIRIPRENFVKVESSNSHMGRTVGRKLLRIEFQSEGEEPGSVAWYVRDLEEWIELLA